MYAVQYLAVVYMQCSTWEYLILDTAISDSPLTSSVNVKAFIAYVCSALLGSSLYAM